jgi:cytochrome c-type biogenesis protein CcmH
MDRHPRLLGSRAAANAARGLFVAVLVLTPATVLADSEAPPVNPADYAEELQGFVPGAAALEGKILAPCCWNQTLDIHGSEPSMALRREIRKRLRAGESADTIQASLVERYGTKILAVPSDSPLKGVAAALALGMVGAGAAAFAMLKRWRSRGNADKARKAKEPQAPPDEKLDARLDAELKALDD